MHKTSDKGFPVAAETHMDPPGLALLPGPVVPNAFSGSSGGSGVARGKRWLSYR